VTYRIRVVCKESQSTHVRAMLLQALSDTEFTVHSVESSRPIADRESVAVCAEISAGGHQDENLEQLVRRISLVSAMSSVPWWELHEQSDSPKQHPTRPSRCPADLVRGRRVPGRTEIALHDLDGPFSVFVRRSRKSLPQPPNGEP